MNIKNLRKNKKGFTLIEIIVVVVILAVLMAVAVPSVLSYMNRADDAKYMATARGAFVSAQAELADAFTDGDATTTGATALTAAVTAINTGVATTDSTHIATIAATGLGTDGNPTTVTAYVITFTNGVVATLTPNGNVEIEPAP